MLLVWKVLPGRFFQESVRGSCRRRWISSDASVNMWSSLTQCTRRPPSLSEGHPWEALGDIENIDSWEVGSRKLVTSGNRQHSSSEFAAVQLENSYKGLSLEEKELTPVAGEAKPCTPRGSWINATTTMKACACLSPHLPPPTYTQHLVSLRCNFVSLVRKMFLRQI